MNDGLTDLDKIRLQLERTIEQGRKLENMAASDDWKFYASWLEAVYSKLFQQIMQPNFDTTSQRKEDFNRGIAQAIRIFIDTPQKFIDKKTKVEKRLFEKE